MWKDGKDKSGGTEGQGLGLSVFAIKRAPLRRITQLTPYGKNNVTKLQKLDHLISQNKILGGG